MEVLEGRVTLMLHWGNAQLLLLCLRLERERESLVEDNEARGPGRHGLAIPHVDSTPNAGPEGHCSLCAGVVQPYSSKLVHRYSTLR